MKYFQIEPPFSNTVTKQAQDKIFHQNTSPKPQELPVNQIRADNLLAPSTKRALSKRFLSNGRNELSPPEFDLIKSISNIVQELRVDFSPQQSFPTTRVVLTHLLELAQNLAKKVT